jgi:hypothetical protein
MPWTRIKVVAAAATAISLGCLLVHFVKHKNSTRDTSSYTAPGIPFHFPQAGSISADVEIRAVKGSLSGLAWFTSSIPIIILRSESPGPVSTSKAYTRFTMDIFEPKGQDPARLGTSPTLTTKAGVRLHGMVSRLFPKLSYRLRLQDEAGLKKALPLLGMPGHADWILQGPWLDKSLIRNAFSYDLAKAMGCAAMRTRPCEVFFTTSGRPATESDYVGVYQLIEHIEHGQERVDITKLTAQDNAEPNITGGYILSWDVGSGNYLPSWKSIQVKYPSHPSREQKKWVDNAFTRFDRALKSKNFCDPVKGYASHIEVDDWVNYILFEELIFNLDGYTRSFYFQKNRGAGIRPGPVWDHDLALGHQFQNGTSFNQWWYTAAGPHGWITRLMSDPAFAKKIAQRWWTLRQNLLKDERIQERVDFIAAPLLSGAAERNFQRWKILDVERPFPKPNDYITIPTATYPEQIVALKAFLHDRAAWMDEHLPKQRPE